MATAKVQEWLRNAAALGSIARSKVGALGTSCLGLLLITALTIISAQQADIRFPADRALARLMEGNLRYVHHKEQHHDKSVARRKELVRL